MRRKIKLAWIEKESARKASLKKRSAGLIRKVEELATLCDVSSCIIIYGGPTSSPEEMWPKSEEEAKLLIRRFMRSSDTERSKKMMNQEEYLKEQATKMSEQLQKMSLKNVEKTASGVLRQIEYGTEVGEFRARELASVARMLEGKIQEITTKIDQSFHHPLPQGFSPAGILALAGPIDQVKPPDHKARFVGFRPYMRGNQSQEFGVGGGNITATLPNPNNWTNNINFGGTTVNIGGNGDAVGSRFFHGIPIGVINKSTNDNTNTVGENIGETLASGMMINEETSGSGTACVADSAYQNETSFEVNNKYWPAL